MKRFIPFFLVSVLVIQTNGELRMSLNANRLDGSWIVWNQNKSIQAPVKVPGGIYSDLQSAGILSENLFYRFNDLDYRWVATYNWTYQRSFDLPSDFMNKTAINLVFHGIDTVGEIHLNGRLLASVDNMFVRYVLPIKNIAKEKNNTLQVRLKSPIHEANRLAEIQKRKYPVPPECTPSYYNGECHVNFLRKMQASFAWDWGPAFPSLGIWKSVEIEAFDSALIRDVALSTIKINESMWHIDIKVHLEHADNYSPNASTISAYLLPDDGTRETNQVEVVMENMVKDPSVRNGYISHGHIYAGEGFFSEWWPNGYGDQPLRIYSFVFESGAEKSEKIIKFGFREVELVQEELQPGKDGRSFYFKVNGVPIFAKGSNWIPGHILPELSYDEDMIRYMLQSVKDANMNMLRVWGGGLYESDAFYRIADELGILIWQDMTFACSMYPTDEKFIESVKTEIEQQVRRLQHHPSIALWAGNNENEAALVGNWYGTSKNFSLYKSDYVKLYVDTIKPVVLDNDISRSYVVSSPSNGIKTDEEGYVAKNPYSEFYGDTHYYNYIFDGWSDWTYPDTRFASEYGFQSMPSFKSMSQVTLPKDRKLESEFSKKRQHLLVGNDFILAQIQRQLPLPENDDSEQFYKTYIYYSQISQAMSTKTETEKYRRDRSKLTADNKGNTMGAMYWQLNDVWQAPSWSSIEFGGKWKMLHYFAKKFFSPVLVSSETTREGFLKVYLISDLLKDVDSVSLKVSVYSWDNFTPRKVHSNNVVLKKASSKVHATYELSSLLSEAGCKKQNCFIYLSVQGPNIFSDNVVYPSKIYEIENLRKPKFNVSFDKTSESSEVKLRITTDRIAPFVWMETDEPGEFSDNGFMLLNKEIVLTFINRRNQPVNFDKLKSTFNIRSVL